MNNNVGGLRMVSAKIPRRREVVVGRIEVPRIFGPEKLEGHAMFVTKRYDVGQSCSGLRIDIVLRF